MDNIWNVGDHKSDHESNAKVENLDNNRMEKRKMDEQKGKVDILYNYRRPIP